MGMPLITICVPVYQVEKYIERCIRSLFSQTYENIEFIFVDDCGTDGSVGILKRIISEHPDKIVRIIRHEYNRGISAARNTAMAAAAGDFIMHVDSDDWLEVDAVEVLVERQIMTGADIVSGNALAHYEMGELLLEEPDYADKEEMLQRVVQMTLDHVIWRRLIRTSLYRKNGIQAMEGVNYGEDQYLLSQIVYYANSFSVVKRVVYHYNCINAGSTLREAENSSLFLKKYCEDIKSINALIDFFSNKNDLCVRELRIQKMRYAHSKLWASLKEGRHDVFNLLCQDMKSVSEYSSYVGWTREHLETVSKCYFIFWCLVRYKIMVKKLTGIKNYSI